MYFRRQRFRKVPSPPPTIQYRFLPVPKNTRAFALQALEEPLGREALTKDR
jgi:hypothetical protein